ncbi:MAG: glycoside hydrolase family 30 beta sandwich domain-containing protein [Rhodothermia bacterium]
MASTLAQTPTPVTIRVDRGRTFQTIEGWGGSLYPQTLKYFTDDPYFKQRLLNDLHTTHVRMRSVWYLLESRNDNDDPSETDFEAIARGDTGMVHNELVLQQLLAVAGVTLQFASWRFPYWMIGKPADWLPASDDKPILPASMDDEYVESMAAYMLYARDRYGFVFDAVSVANEPDLGIYISGLPPERLLRLSRMLDERLKSAGYETRFYLPDVAAADSIGMRYTQEYFQLEGAADFTTALAYHSYRRDPDVIKYFGEEARRLGLPVWVTEQSHTAVAVEDRFNWSHALSNAESIYDVLVGSDATLSLYWSLAMSSSSGLGLYIPEDRKWAPAYDMLKHFFNDVPVGSIRILAQSDGPEGLKTVAFKLPDSEAVSVILINTGPEVLEVTFMFAGARAKIERATVSEPLDTLQDRLPNMPIVIPPRSVSTIRLADDR